ncbi:Centromere/kinetochore protein zw10 [Entophlyctis sp. JEL0112]|nr:Centromere/kinetochore protein zw10 [Entophlyctis sp. JEL0112]
MLPLRFIPNAESGNDRYRKELSALLDHGILESGIPLDYSTDLAKIQDMWTVAKKASKGSEILATERRNHFEWKIKLLVLLEKIHRELAGFDSMMETKELSGAAIAISDAVSAGKLEDLDCNREQKAFFDELNDMPVGYNCPPEIYQALKSEIVAKKSTLKYNFEDLFRKAFCFNSRNGYSELTISFRIISESIAHNIEARQIRRTGSKPEASVFPASLLKNMSCIDRIIENPGCEVAVSRSKMAGVIRIGVGKSLHQEGKENKTNNQKKDVAEALRKIFETTLFLRDCAFGLAGEVTQEWKAEYQCFSTVLQSTLLPGLFEELLGPSIPDYKEHAEEFRSFLECVKTFAEKMKNSSLLLENVTAFEYFTSNARNVCIRNRRAHLLVQVRNIIESEDSNTFEVEEATERGSLASLFATKAGGGKFSSEGSKTKIGAKSSFDFDFAAFRLPKCRVSVQAQTLVELAYQILNEGAMMTAEYAIEALYFTRDIFDMFRSVVPALRSEEILHSPARAAIFHNDCDYIVFHLLTLGYQFQDKFPEPFNKCITFLDIVPFLRNLGDTCFRSQMRDILGRILKSSRGFSSLAEDDRFESVEITAKEVMSQLNSLWRTWKPLLAADKFFASMGLLVDFLLRSVMEEISSLGTMSKAEKLQLRYILSIFRKCEELFEADDYCGRDTQKVSSSVGKC